MPPKKPTPSDTLTKAEQFLTNYTAPPPPKPPPKAWDLLLGRSPQIDEECDARECRPPCPPAWPHPDVAWLTTYAEGRWELHCAMRTEDGRWLEIL